MNSLIAFLIVLGPLIFVHEFGHFIFAKLFGVKVLKFSLGFGPKLIGHRHGETEYVLSALPLGGYVKMLGEQNEEEVSEQEANRTFVGKPPWQRFIIVLAGPATNLLFAVFIFFLIFATIGLPQLVDNNIIGGVSPNNPAAEAGLLPGDRIVSINDKATTTWQEIATLITQSKGEELTLVIHRGEETITVKAKARVSPDRDPIFGEEIGKRYMLGISRSEAVIYEKISLSQALLAGFGETWAIIYLNTKALVKMILHELPASELGGPIKIAQMAGKQMEAGWLYLTRFMALISVSLGILNLLPIPILDGGHLMFFTYEALIRRPMPPRVMEIGQQIGLVLLLGLMVFVFYNDISGLFTKG
jgi:regulator of sigma E protease